MNQSNLEIPQGINPEVYRGVVGSIYEVLNDSDVTVLPYHHLTNDLGFESLDYLELGFCLERRFGIMIPQRDGAFSGATTTPQLVEYVTPLINKDRLPAAA